MPSFWPRSLFGRNLLLLFSLALVVQVSGIAVVFYLLRPRIVELGMLVATQINTLDEVLSGVPPAQRDYYIQRIERGGQFVVLDADEGEEDTLRSRSLLVALFVRTVRNNLNPDIPFHWHYRHGPRWMAGVDIGGRRYWIASPIGFQLQGRALFSALLLPTVMAIAAVLVAILIQRRINRPLKDIAEVARKLGEGGRPERLPIYETSELAAVARQFNAMFDSLEEMESTRAVMLAGISHDIRTPLTKLRLALAMDGRGAEEASLRYIEQIDAIVGQFLDFGRIGHDEPFAEGDLNVLIRQLAGLFEERGHRFELALQALPPCRFRPVAMSRIVTNLMDNAAKYGMHGLQVSSRCEGGFIHVAVLDRGPGWPEAHERDALTKPFVRANGARAGLSGTGLGLAIVDRLARLHGGSLQLRNRPGGGAEALVTLRVASGRT